MRKINEYGIGITQHAFKRMDERLGRKPYRVYKAIANEAWLSKEPLGNTFEKRDANLSKYGFETYVYKAYNNDIFVFQLKDVPVLITLYEKKNNL